MKYQVTQKYIKAVYNPIFSIPYCNAQSLLFGLDAFGYNAGVYGWNCDYYYINGVCICTGYRPHGKKTKYEKTRFFEEQAKTIYNNYNLEYNERINKIAEIRNNWLNALTED